MKMIVLAAVTAALVIGTPGHAQGNGKGHDKPPAPEAVEYCSQYGGGPVGRGRCTAFHRTDDPVALCNIADAFGFLDDLGFKNRGECVKALTQADE